MSGAASEASAVPPALVSARALVAALVRLGVRDVVLAPGSRSAPLAYAVADASARGELTLHVRIDERDAAFLALGIARGRALDAPVDPREPRVAPAPVAVVTTSGTAVANLHPAVLEADHAGVPLLLVTADRPHELRGTGANQTTDQRAILEGAARLTVDVPAPDGRPGEERDVVHAAARAVDAARGGRSGRPGPAHLNVAYRDPLAPAADLGELPEPADTDTLAASPALARPAPTVPDVRPATRCDVDPALDVALPAGRTVVVAGDGAGRVARALAEARGWPLLAEPVSGAAGGPALVHVPTQVLAHGGLVDEVEHVVVVGRATLARPVQRLLARDGVEVVVVATDGGPWPDAARNASVVLPAVPAAWLEPGRRDDAWLDLWTRAGRAAAAAVDDVASLDGPDTAALVSAPQAVRLLADVLTPDDVLVVGSSNPVRDLDLVHRWAEPPAVVANRGLAGIDGLVATATGVALARASVGQRRPVRAVLGDVTFLHDVGGLLGAPGEPRPELQVVVVNDGGGSIFAGLEHGELARVSARRAEVFERVFSTPHSVDLGALCAAYGVRHVRATTPGEVRAALAAPPEGTSVLEVVVDRAGRRDAAAAVAGAVRAALATR
ncbi:2-succinyl-5-enolpyruvyl-6-hydroxy-3-cyclohexene-1-carboxylic-acid synthase [Sanguibacter hominis ATCC BAA-789]|uniref:2-succinyl-5-enolpyruvyl-6-hydroxy-3-cyclohexene-1-carboxylate synthase n=1 Tax=Sanguibacter hominis ATCC BAA-789 TaxID=1312740 RepID=A0A9X5IRT4_9MICO|nr:2-succinyl-5-enolpyruvyl-6-hydroxy-3-cyclohexene-1-carboxylic-acid synthase [Sanguibacter hominis ATCC BAA-789]